MRKITKRSAAIIAATVVAVGGGAAAWATLSSWGDGTADVTATTSTVTPISGSITLATDANHRLFPGRTISVDDLLVNNENDYDVVLTGATVSSVSVPSGSTCTTEKAAISAGNPSGTIIEKGGSTVSIANFIKMNDWASPDCSNTAITIHLALTGNVHNS